MSTYRTRPEGFAELRRTMLLKGIPLGLVALGVGVGIPYFGTGSTSSAQGGIFPVFLLLLAGSFAYGIYRAIAQQKQLYDSYRLTISDQQIVREQYNTPTIVIPVAEVTSISKNPNGSFVIRGLRPQDVMGVPQHVEPYETVEAQLHTICPVALQAQGPVLDRLRVPLTLLTLGLTATVFLATNKLLVGVSGISLSGFLMWSFFRVRGDQNVDNATKKSMYWSAFVVLIILVITIAKLRAQ